MKDLDFEAIFERHHQGLYRFCLSIVGNPEDARDALQNTMVKALRSLPGEQREIQLQPWLYRVAHNESIDLLRRRRDQVELDAEPAGSGSGLAEEAEVRDRLRTLLADLRELPERQRAALVMRELSGLEFAEIGEAFGTSAAVARQTVYEARLSLQQLKAGREMDCEKVRWELSGEDGRVTRRRDIQAHLHDCAECRAFNGAISDRRHDLAALAPLPAAASAGLLQAVLGGKAGGAAAAAAGGTVGKVAATSTLVKSVATVAVVTAVAVPAADRSGLVDTGLFGRGSSSGQATRAVGEGGAKRGTVAGAAPSASTVTGARRANAPAAGVSPNDAPAAPASEATANAGDPSGSAPGSASEQTTPRGKGHSAHEGALPQASAHGQETAAAHGGGRASAGSKGKKHAHAPKGTPAGKPAKSNPHGKGKGTADKKGGESRAPSAVQAPDVSPDKGTGPPLQPPNGNPDKPEEPGAGKSKEAQ